MASESIAHSALAYEQALLFERVKRVSRERASERRTREGASALGPRPFLVHSREAHFARAFSQVNSGFGLMGYIDSEPIRAKGIIGKYQYSTSSNN